MDSLQTIHRFALGKTFGDRYLTKREIEVLKFVVMGCTAKQIGQSLRISFRTVETYIETLKSKLECTSKGDISMVVFKTGLIRELGLFE